MNIYRKYRWTSVTQLLILRFTSTYPRRKFVLWQPNLSKNTIMLILDPTTTAFCIKIHCFTLFCQNQIHCFTLFSQNHSLMQLRIFTLSNPYPQTNIKLADVGNICFPVFSSVFWMSCPFPPKIISAVLVMAKWMNLLVVRLLQLRCWLLNTNQDDKNYIFCHT